MGNKSIVDYRPLGTTGLNLSVIGYGAFKIGRNVGIKYPGAYDLPEESRAIQIVHQMLDLGINYIDTAPAYGLSEQRVGKALRDVLPGDVIVSTKVGETFSDGRSTFDFSAQGVRRSVDNSCRVLGRDPLDLVFIHSSGNDLHIINETDCVPTLCALRDQGRIKAIGFSGKTVEGAQAALTWADAIMVEYHLNDQSHEAVIQQAGESGVGVVVKKGLASGHLSADDAIPFVLRSPHVTSLVIGGLNVQHMRDNIRAASRNATDH